jgi:hypothetical protein
MILGIIEPLTLRTSGSQDSFMSWVSPPHESGNLGQRIQTISTLFIHTTLTTGFDDSIFCIFRRFVNADMPFRGGAMILRVYFKSYPAMQWSVGGGRSVKPRDPLNTMMMNPMLTHPQRVYLRVAIRVRWMELRTWFGD